jgi:hypothetical protein
MFIPDSRVVRDSLLGVGENWKHKLLPPYRNWPHLRPKKNFGDAPKWKQRKKLFF